jgi:hypothetical protein
MVHLLRVLRLKNCFSFGLEVPPKEALVGPVPALLGVRAFHHFPVDVALVFH